YRGRQDVLPTGRNLFAVDPRAVPTPSAHAQGIKLAEELLRRHLQDHGDWPKGLVVDLWGSATMRTAGEEFAMALHLAGLAPHWDHASGRVTGYDILAPGELGRPRIDVTLRVSGLFRDVFAGLAQLFEAATEALAADYAAHEAGLAAAAAHLGAAGPSLYHLDTTRPDEPHARTLTEEISRVVRARAANPAWIAGMMRHGFRGAAEITATLEHMAA